MRLVQRSRSPRSRSTHRNPTDVAVAEPFRTWGAMFRRFNLRNFLHVVPPWLLFAAGLGVVAYGDTRGYFVLVVLGFGVMLPSALWFMLRVWRVLFSDEREADRRSPE